MIELGTIVAVSVYVVYMKFKYSPPPAATPGEFDRQLSGDFLTNFQTYILTDIHNHNKTQYTLILKYLNFSVGKTNCQHVVILTIV